MSQTSDPSRGTPLPVERRRFPRITILKQLQSEFVSLDVPVRTCEIGSGGFSIETPVLFPAGAVHEFLLTRDDGVSSLVTARAVHSRQVGGGEPALYLTGFEFVLEDLRTRRIVDELIDRLRQPPDVL